MAGLEALMEFSYIDYKIWMGVAIVVASCIYGFWLGITGR
jgi:hypothetical protein